MVDFGNLGVRSASDPKRTSLGEFGEGVGMKGIPAALQGLHDASLVSVEFNWNSRHCVLRFSGAPNPALQRPFSIDFEGVTMVTAPAEHPWGTSGSVLEVKSDIPGKYAFVMQSGDEIVVATDREPVRKALD